MDDVPWKGGRGGPEASCCMCAKIITPETGCIMEFSDDVREFMCFGCMVLLAEGIDKREKRKRR